MAQACPERSRRAFLCSCPCALPVAASFYRSAHPGTVCREQGASWPQFNAALAHVFRAPNSPGGHDGTCPDPVGSRAVTSEKSSGLQPLKSLCLLSSFGRLRRTPDIADPGWCCGTERSEKSLFSPSLLPRPHGAVAVAALFRGRAFPSSAARPLPLRAFSARRNLSSSFASLFFCHPARSGLTPSPMRLRHAGPRSRGILARPHLTNAR